MTTTCPKCAYVRQPTDAAPDYECPKCGIIYAKFRPSGQPSVARQVEAKTAKSSLSPVVAIILWTLLGALGVGGGVYAYTLKQERDKIAATRASLAQLNAAATRFAQAIKLAGSTGRIALAGPVKDLQTIANDVKALVPVGCAASAHKFLMLATDSAVEGFLAFMSGGSHEDASTVALRTAGDQMGFYREKVDSCTNSLQD